MANAFCMEALPLFLDRLTGPIAAVVISTTAVLAFGEIIPQAICTRYGLAVGAYTYWFVWILIALLSPVAWPISKLLDCVLGTEEQALYRRAELKELVGYHGIGHHDSDDSDDEEEGEEEREHEHCGGTERYDSTPGDNGSEEELSSNHLYRSELRSSHNSELTLTLRDQKRKKSSARPDSDKLTKDEVRIIRGALELRDKTVLNTMTPWSNCFTIPYSSVMDLETMKRIFESGHSRIPVWREDDEDVLGMILVKQLILLSPADATPVSSLHIHRIPMISSTMSLFQLLNIFQTGRSHLAIVVSPRDHITPMGVITLEDVIEELIQGEILDETDRYIDMQKGNERPGGRRSRTFSNAGMMIPSHPVSRPQPSSQPSSRPSSQPSPLNTLLFENLAYSQPSLPLPRPPTPPDQMQSPATPRDQPHSPPNFRDQTSSPPSPRGRSCSPPTPPDQARSPSDPFDSL